MGKENVGEVLRWQRSRWTLGFPYSSNTAVLRSDRLDGTPGKLICKVAEGSAQLEGDSVAGGRWVEVNLGREKTVVPWRRGNVFHRETKGSEREGLRKCSIEFTQEENLSGP